MATLSATYGTSNTTNEGHHAHAHHAHSSGEKQGLRDIRWGELLGEFVGVAALVYFGGYVVLQADAARATELDVALTHGVILGVITFVLGRYYIPQINPAITITAVVLRKQNWLSGLLYIISQLVGSIVGAAFLRAMVPGAILAVADNASVLGFPHIPADATQGQTFFNEFIFTFILVTLFFTITYDRRVSTNVLFLAFGGVYFISILVIAPTTVSALNPARVFGPAVVSNDWERSQWVFWIAPLVGALLAGIVYEFGIKRFHRSNTDKSHTNAHYDHEDASNLLGREPVVRTEPQTYSTFTNRPLFV